jgi:hypothetical protein
MVIKTAKPNKLQQVVSRCFSKWNLDFLRQNNKQCNRKLLHINTIKYVMTLK